MGYHRWTIREEMNHQVALAAIQRRVAWETIKIELLFGSTMCDDPPISPREDRAVEFNRPALARINCQN